MAGGMPSLLAIAQHEAMLFALTCFLVLATDELVVDFIWLVRAGYRRFGIYRKFRRATALSLPQPVRQPRFALFVATWKEAEVISGVLESALCAYRGHDVTVFVGCYVNDEPTQSVVRRFARQGVHIALNETDGPTTKAENLNSMWRALRSYEAGQRRFDGIIIHDAEDEIDQHEILIFSSLYSRFSALHLPVIPIASLDTRWVGNHYCDEFAEAHIKAQVVREAVGAGLPSAGVGCMLRRDLLDALDRERPGEPFEAQSLTEDYELGLTAKRLGLSSAFIRMSNAPGGATVATRARFPHEFKDAVRQKSRWIAGIAIAGWDRTGWGTGVAEHWMRLRDRKSLIAAVALCAGYGALLLWAFTALIGGAIMPKGIIEPGVVATAIWVSVGLLAWRLVMRFACVTYTHGLRQGLWSMPRVVICNAIAIAASWRAVGLHLTNIKTGRVRWDKTEHHPARRSPK